jgi:AmmeMemoRadiSam system protein A
MAEQLSSVDKKLLIKIAREALEIGVHGGLVEPINLNSLPINLQNQGVTFVTLTYGGKLRGCIGALEATRPLAEDVQQHTIAAALSDYRFPPVNQDELEGITIEISFLTPPMPLTYEDPQDLIDQLRPAVDGVVIRDGMRRATFLPQVWEKIPDVVTFLNMLCHKMGSEPELWKRKKLEVFTYQVEKFSE